MNTNTQVFAPGLRLLRPERLMELHSLARGIDASGHKPEPPTADNPGRGLLWTNGGRPRKSEGTKSAVAVVPISGFIMQKGSVWMEYFGGTSCDGLGATIDLLANDPEVKGIILDCDSPGGTALGVPECAAKIFAAREKKPVCAVSNCEMDSAAYWLGSAASKVFVSPSSYTGSIGVWTAFAEYTKMYAESGINLKMMRSEQSPFKAELTPFEEWSKQALEHEQAELNRIYDAFAGDVVKHRGVSVVTVRKDFGQGRTMDARSAVAAGAADRVATLEQVIARMLNGKLSLNAMNDAAAFAAEWPVDVFTAEDQVESGESWKDQLEGEKMMSEWRRKKSA